MLFLFGYSYMVLVNNLQLSNLHAAGVLALPLKVRIYLPKSFESFSKKMYFGQPQRF